MVEVTKANGSTHQFQEADDFKINGTCLQILHDDYVIAMFNVNQWTFVTRSKPS